MSGKLMIARLSMQSSYLQDLEEPAEEGFDTIQVWIDTNRSWKVVTYFVDHDIHVHEVDTGDMPDPVEFWNGHFDRIYGDVLESRRVLSFEDANNREEVARVLKDASLGSYLEVKGDLFAFWNPDGERYFTQSEPK